jgi:hypothetical protein
MVLFENSKSVYAHTQVSFCPVGFSLVWRLCYKSRAVAHSFHGSAKRGDHRLGAFFDLRNAFLYDAWSLATLPATAYVRGLGSRSVISSAMRCAAPCVYLFRKPGLGA